jgi:hypothetical protein
MANQHSGSLRERFDANYTPEPNSGCWLWTAGWGSGGYGFINSGGRQLKAHRASWALHRGNVPDGIKVLHRCDTPACVNPDHLFLGTDADNNADKIAKGRNKPPSFSSKDGEIVLDEAAVKVIRSEYAPGVYYHEIATRYGVSPTTISRIINRQTWRHVS